MYVKGYRLVVYVQGCDSMPIMGGGKLYPCPHGVNDLDRVWVGHDYVHVSR